MTALGRAFRLPFFATLLAMAALLLSRGAQAQEDVEEASEDPAEEPSAEAVPGQERDPSSGPQDAAASESLLQLGVALFRQGKLDAACPKIEQALSSAPSGEGALWLGRCAEKQGRTATAWASYRQASLMLAHAGRQDDAREAEARAVELEPKVSKLTVVPAREVPGMDVVRGGVSFGAGIFGVPVAIDPGKHEVEVRAPGHRRWTASVTVGRDGDRVVLAVPPLEPANEPAASSAPGPRSDDGPSILLPAGIITAGAGVAAIGVGAILGAVAARDAERAATDEALCGSDKVCTEAGYELVEGAQDRALGATVALISGGIAVALGVTLVIVDAYLEPDEEGARLRVETSGAGARLTLGF